MTKNVQLLKNVIKKYDSLKLYFALLLNQDICIWNVSVYLIHGP